MRKSMDAVWSRRESAGREGISLKSYTRPSAWVLLQWADRKKSFWSRARGKESTPSRSNTPRHRARRLSCVIAPPSALEQVRVRIFSPHLSPLSP